MTATLDAPMPAETMPSETVTVSTDELIIGRTLSFPVYDEKGVLLLSDNSVITAELKKRLAERGNGTVVLSQEDASNVRFEFENEDEEGPAFGFDDAVTARMDGVLDSGMLLVKNSGSAVRNSMVLHGCKAYDSELRESLIAQHQAASESIDEMLRAAVKGNAVHGKHIAQGAAQYLKNLTTDCDHQIAVAFEASHDAELADHSVKVSILGMALGVEMDLDADNVRNLGVIGLVQDWGMARVPQAIRNADRPLTPVEFLEIQKHPRYAIDLIERIAELPKIAAFVAYQMHEMFDGSGYPRGRSGRDIHLFARILRVADTYVALTTKRSHRRPLMPYAAMELILREANQRRVDPEVARALLKTLSLFPVGSYVTLSDGSVAKVLRANREAFNAPVVQWLQDPHGDKVDPESDVATIDLSTSELSIVQALPTPGRNELSYSPDLHS